MVDPCVIFDHTNVFVTKFDLPTYFGCWNIAFLSNNYLIRIFLDKLTFGWPLRDLEPDKNS